MQRSCNTIQTTVGLPLSDHTVCQVICQQPLLSRVKYTGGGQKSSVATCARCGGIFNIHITKFTKESSSEKNCKSVKIWTDRAEDAATDIASATDAMMHRL